MVTNTKELGFQQSLWVVQARLVVKDENGNCFRFWCFCNCPSAAGFISVITVFRLVITSNYPQRTQNTIKRVASKIWIFIFHFAFRPHFLFWSILTGTSLLMMKMIWFIVQKTLLLCTSISSWKHTPLYDNCTRKTASKLNVRWCATTIFIIRAPIFFVNKDSCFLFHNSVWAGLSRLRFRQLCREEISGFSDDKPAPWRCSPRSDSPWGLWLMSQIAACYECQQT